VRFVLQVLVPLKQSATVLLPCATEDISKPGDKIPDLKPDAGMESLDAFDKLRFSSGPIGTASLRSEMQKVMQVTSDNAPLFCLP
jgi:hypothetical protein